METFEQILDKIILPFREEYKQKCRNSSVVGGFDRYICTWIEKAIKNCPPKAGIKECLEDIKSKVTVYQFKIPSERASILKEIHPIISDLKEGKVIQKPVVPVPEKRINTDIIKRKIADQFKYSDDKPTKLSLESPVSRITGVGPRIESILNRANIFKVEDILFYLPREYQDRRKIRSIGEIEPEGFQVIIGTLGRVENRKIRKNLTLTKSAIYDDCGSISLAWFNQPYLSRMLRSGKKYIVSGKVECKFRQMQIVAPEIEEIDELDTSTGKIIPVYSLTEGLSQKFIRKLIESAVRKYADQLEEVFPDDLREQLGLLPIAEAVKKIHSPDEMDDAIKAAYRFRFEEAFFLHLVMSEYRKSFCGDKKEQKYNIDPNFVDEFESHLPYKLTASQRKVIDKIIEDLKGEHPMNRLLQGDVGSGKTIVCALAAVIAAKSGYQAAILAPTEILAEQHYYTFRDLLAKFGIEVDLLLGATPTAKKRQIKSGLESGDLQVIIGTHAVIQEDVVFNKLGFAVIDEQHKFGVLQRATLKDKGAGADFLFTTATPIPRSLCLTIYGDLDLSIIDEMPPGRQPIKCMWIPPNDKEKLYQFIEKEISEGGQIYIVCPLIEESEKIDATPLLNEYENICQRFPNISISLLHGRMKGEEKEAIMKDFAAGTHKILVSTIVIEVGIDVPGASVMVILDAWRFGLGQLHQLRGRVGRGSRKSYCILVSDQEGEESTRRLDAILRTNSGFDIAEEDLKMRGPGDFAGVRQSGLTELRFLDIVRDYGIITKAREVALQLQKEDEGLTQKKYFKIKEKLNQKYKKIWDILH